MKIQVWDKIIRFCHWGTVLLLPLCWFTAEQGEMEWHLTCAYLLLALLITRFMWGVLGSDTARFGQFVRSPKQVFSYLAHWRHDKKPHIGHNPAGGYAVLAMLSLIAIQLISGLFTTDDILTEGPLYSWVSSDLASTLTWLHRVNFNLLLAIIGLHLSALLLYRLKGVKLIGAMLTGHRNDVELTHAPRIISTRLAWCVLLGLFALLSWGLIWPLW